MPTRELPSPTGLIQAALQRSLDLVSFGLQAGASASVGDLSLPESFLQLTPAQNLAMPVDTARREFPIWVLANGFRDCVEAIGPALEWARRTCYLWSRPGAVALHPDGRVMLRADITGEEWNRYIVAQAIRFDRLPLPDKIGHLQKEYAFPPPSATEAILMLNAARNCLAHRRGVVGPQDLKHPQDPGLSVKIRRFQVTVKGPTGERVIDGPSSVEAGDQLGVGFIESERVFPLGQAITFNPREYLDVCTTFLSFALELQAGIIAYQDRRRAEASPPPGKK